VVIITIVLVWEEPLTSVEQLPQGIRKVATSHITIKDMQLPERAALADTFTDIGVLMADQEL
jgi:hypothetical protein